MADLGDGGGIGSRFFVASAEGAALDRDEPPALRPLASAGRGAHPALSRRLNSAPRHGYGYGYGAGYAHGYGDGYCIHTPYPYAACFFGRNFKAL
jgi:hypothetical protein